MEGSWGSQENPWERSPARCRAACLHPAGPAGCAVCGDSPALRAPTVTVGVHLAEDLLGPLLWGWLIFWHLHHRRNHLVDCLCDRQKQKAGKKHIIILMQGYNDPLVTEPGRKYPRSTSKTCSWMLKGVGWHQYVQLPSSVAHLFMKYCVYLVMVKHHVGLH